jgi:F-type H+-transporting ATPase subunit a
MEEVFPKVVLTVFGMPIRDTVISTWVAVAIILGLAWLAQRKLPGAVEMLIDFLRGQISDVMGGIDVDPYVPFVGALLIFLIVANNLGLVPLLQTPTKDINTPLALAIVVLLAVHGFAIQKKGLRGYLKEKASPLTILDVISDFSRTMSLSLRLFGNIIASEIIVAVMYRLVAPVAPLLMVFLGLITSILQAYIFMVLTTSAIAGAVRSDS